jgi:hypothetical protein
MRFSLLALAGSLLLGGPTQAAEPGLIDHWSQPVVERLLQSLGATDIQPLAGQPGLLARTADGLSIGVYAKACVTTAASTAPYCRGVEGLTSFDPGRGANGAGIADRLNRQYDAGKFTLEADGSIRLTRYIDVDAGVSEANLRSQLRGFLALADAAKDAVWSAPAR